MNDDANENSSDDYGINNENTTTSTSFKYKTNVIGRSLINNNTLNTEFE